MGGAEGQTISLMKGLVDTGHAVSFLGSCPVLLKKSAEFRIQNSELHIGPPPVTKWGAVTFCWRKFKMKSILHSAFSTLHSVDAICMLSLTEKILLTPYALKKGIKVLWIEHDKVGNWLSKNPSLPLLKKLSAEVTTVCVSNVSATIFRNLGYNNVVVIPNGVPEPPADFIPHEFDDTLRLGCIARLSYEKGVDILSEAVRDCDNVTLLINGKGDQHIPSTPTITIKANVDNINEVYRAIDVLVLPSRQEDPFGLVVAEAMLRGIAVICTDACGVAEHLTSGTGSIVVPAGSKQALVEAINSMQNEEFRMQIAAAGKKTAQEKFAISQMVKRYEALIR